MGTALIFWPCALNVRQAADLHFELVRKVKENRRFNQESAIFLHLRYKNDIFLKRL